MDKEALLIKLGKRIRELRQQKAVTQVQLANAVGKDQQSIQRLESGKINPSYFYLCEIALGLNMDIEELFKKPEA